MFRKQSEWHDDGEPVIQVNARAGRNASAARNAVTYSVHYILHKMGVNVPKRWNSTFTSTAPEQSMFMDGQTSGVRRVVVPDDRPIGFAKDDYNADAFEDFGARKILRTIGDYLQTLDETPAIEDMFEELSLLLYAKDSNDEGYAKFLGTAERLDQMLTSLGKPTFTEQMHASMKPFVDAGDIGATTKGHAPEGNYEVWFEGPYEAHVIPKQ